MDANANGVLFLFLGLIAIVIIALIIGVVCCIVDALFCYELETVNIKCTITHMEIDNGDYLLTVVGDDFAKTLKISVAEYANYKVGDSCIVIGTGYYYPTRGNVYEYEIVRCK